uniref:Uncharacterized protein n=1 Tax=Anguilla anguilla TaxID=7936 RepID=A0A0E9S7I1_ANGAN
MYINMDNPFLIHKLALLPKCPFCSQVRSVDSKLFRLLVTVKLNIHKQIPKIAILHIYHQICNHSSITPYWCG